MADEWWQSAPLDESIGRGRFAAGEAQLQDLSDDAVRVLGPSYPKPPNDVVSKLLPYAIGGGLYSGYLPLGIAGAAAAPLLYSRAGNAAARAALAGRQGATWQALREGVEGAAPRFAFGVYPYSQEYQR